MKRGHSNIYNTGAIKPYPTNPDRISIPIQGGASVTSVRELPTLSLSKREWEEIGKTAGWID